MEAAREEDGGGRGDDKLPQVVFDRILQRHVVYNVLKRGGRAEVPSWIPPSSSPSAHRRSAPPTAPCHRRTDAAAPHSRTDPAASHRHRSSSCSSSYSSSSSGGKNRILGQLSRDDAKDDAKDDARERGQRRRG